MLILFLMLLHNHTVSLPLSVSATHYEFRCDLLPKPDKVHLQVTHLTNLQPINLTNNNYKEFAKLPVVCLMRVDLSLLYLN